MTRIFLNSVTVLLFFIFSFALDTQAQTRYYVSATATGAETGTSWQDAFTTLTAAITKSATGNEIWVARGTYISAATTAGTFTLKTGVKIYGGFAGNETSLSQRVAGANGLFTVNESILDGQNINYHVVTSSNNNTTLLDGFTITRGLTLGTSTSLSAAYIGAGIYVSGGAGVFQNLWLKGNNASAGGGAIYSAGVSAAFKNLLVEGNNLQRAGSGAGIYNTGASATFEKITFRNNTGASTGGGINNVEANVTMTDVAFENHSVTTYGGGLFNSGNNLNINRASFIGNNAIVRGGGLYSVTGTGFVLNNSVFSQNAITSVSASYLGGGLYFASGSGNIYNCTFSNNTIPYSIDNVNTYGAALYSSPTTFNVYNSIFWGNKRGGDVPDQLNTSVKFGVSNNLIQNGFDNSVNTIIGDPEFENAAINDLRLKNGSVAINVGVNAQVGTVTDIAGNTRIVDGVVDLGAYEHPIGAPASILLQPSVIGNVTRGNPYQLQLTTSGSGAATFQVTYGSLPPGIKLNTQTGLLSGIAMLSGDYNFVVKVSGGGQTTSKQYTMNVNTSPARLHVRASATSGDNSGANWTDAYVRLQTAIELAKSGDEIWVAKGTYSPAQHIDSTFNMVSGVKIYGGFAGTETQLNQRVADAKGKYTVNESILSGNNINNHVVYSVLALSSESTLDGFTITAGLANSSGVKSYGAGIYISAVPGNGIYNNLVIKNNSANTYGAGMYNNSVGIHLNNISFENNVVTTTNRYGGGLYNSGANLELNNVSFKGNQAINGGGMWNNGAGVTITKSTFEENAATSGGGLYTSGTVNINQASFIKNTSIGNGGGLYGIGTITVTNSIFSTNSITAALVTTATYGGGMYFSGTGTITNCTFSNNTTNYTVAGATTYGTGLYAAPAAFGIYNSIFWGNKRGNDVADQIGGTVTNLAYNLIQDDYNYGSNTIIGSPEFENALAHDLRLKNGSVAINAGSNAYVGTANDLAGNARIINNIVDLGAYENTNASAGSLAILPATLPVARRGAAYSQQLSTSETSGVITWELTYGTPPLGILFNKQTGVLSGVPMYSGTYTFVIKAIQNGVMATRQYNLQVNDGATRWHVKANATGANNGADWTNGLTRLQSALGMAKDGDEIWVAKGVYSPAAHVDSTFNLVSGVKLYGGFAGTETLLSQRIADANGKFTLNNTELSGASINKHVVSSTTLMSVETLLDGFTVSGGNATVNAIYGTGIYSLVAAVNGTYKNLIVKNNIGATLGAGMYNTAIAIKLENILFEGNMATLSTRYGGGLYNNGANAIINNVTFRGNQAIQGGGMYNNSNNVTTNNAVFENNSVTTIGGGLVNAGSNFILNNAVFENNTATTAGGGFNTAGSATLTDVTFRGNKATTTGAGISGTGTLTIDRGLFINNIAVQNGGGIFMSGTGTTTLTNVAFSRNAVTSTSTYYGGGVYAGSTTTNIVNGTFSKNTVARTAVNSGGGLYRAGGTVNVTNSILWGNTQGTGLSDQLNTGVTSVANSTVEDGYATGSAILVGDPLFTDPANDNLTLKTGSLAIDKGNNAATATSKDLDGNPRIYNSIVDHGAYENQGGASLKITPLTLGTITRGTLVDIQLVATGGTAPYTWSILSGDLPLGLSITASGRIQGRVMKSTPGGDTFVIAVADGTLIGSKQYTIEAVPAPARFYVKKGATGKANGISWTDAFTDLLPTLNYVVAGDEIWVAKGTYLPGTGTDVNGTFTMKSGVKWYGGFAGTENELTERVADANKLYAVNETILSGNNKSYHVVTNLEQSTKETIIDGFSITGGRTATGSTSIAYSAAGIYNNAGEAVFRNLWVKNNNADRFGAGIYNNGPSTFENIRIEKNIVAVGAGYGGGLYNLNAFAILRNLTFVENEAIYGGGMFNTVANLTAENLTFLRNKASTAGAGIYHNTGILNLKKSTFEGNAVVGNGGGLMTTTGLNAEDLVFKNNTATTTGAGIMSAGTLTLNRVSFIGNISGQHGAGLYNYGASRLDNVVFSQNKITTNSTSGYGAGMYNYGGASVLSNTSFSNNTTAYIHATTSTGAGFYFRAGSTAIYNSIFWGNKRGNNISDQIGGAVTIANSIVENGYVGGTNISIGNPLFTDAATDNLKVKGGSPAIDVGDNAASGTSLDLANLPRIVNGIVDLGAYENQGGESLSILPTTLPGSVRGTNINVQFTATGGGTSLTWSVSSGTLPTGLSLSAGGLLSGRTMYIGNYTFVVSVTDGEFAGAKQYNVVVTAGATNIYVSEGATTGRKDGSSWPNAFTDLQLALGQATAGDQIWVAKGNYSPGLLATSTFTLKENVKIYGGFAGTEETFAARDTSLIHTIHKSILDGSQGVASYHVVSSTTAVTSETILDGFTISGGRTLTTTSTSYPSVPDLGANYYGAGIYTSLGRPIFNNLIITNNTALYGGGAFVLSGVATFTNSKIIANSTIGNLGRGAGIYNHTGGITVDKVLFEGNFITAGSNTYGGAIFNSGTALVSNTIFKDNITGGTGYAYGGAIYSGTTLPVKIFNTTFIGNQALNGGAVYINSGSPEFTDVTFKSNRSRALGGAVIAAGSPVFERVYFIDNESTQHGGALQTTGTAKLNNVVFSRNRIVSSTTAVAYGGAMYAGSTATLTNVTFSNNSISRTAAGGGALYRAGGTVTISNSIFWGNNRADGVADQILGVVTIDKSIVQDGITGGTNIAIGNPLFTDAAADNLRLKGGSPAIDMGDNTKVIGTTDVEGNPRIFNDIVDMGAFENQGTASLIISPATLQAYNRGDLLEVPLTVSSGTGNLVWNITSGVLPSGLGLDANGVLKGRPMEAGTFTFVVGVTDGSLVGRKQYTILVNPSATQLFVNVVAVSGRNDGSSWEHGFTDLKVAIAKALAGDQIWVAKGSYSPGTLATSWFTMKEGVQVYGGFAGTETKLSDRTLSLIHTGNQTILDGSEGLASRHVIFNNIALSNTTVLDGFTISGGQGLAGTDSDNNRGAGIYNYGSVKAIFRNLRVINNKAERGAGIYNMGAAVYDKILFEGNEANSIGGGFFNLSGTIMMTDVTFRGNSAKVNSGGLSQSGGIVNIDRGSFIANTAGQQGGGMFNSSGTANLTNVIFSRNAVTTAGGYYGGGIYSAATTNLNNVTFSDNKIAFTNATTIGGAGLYRSAGTVTINNSIFWGNTRGGNVPDQLTAALKVSNSIVQGGYPTGINILIGDPLFINSALDDLQLKGGSPAIDAGDNSSNTSTIDLAGNPRIINDIIDIGAYESLGGNGLKIQPSVFPSSARGLDPNFQMSVTGGTGDYTWTLQSGTLPTGLILTENGLITGRPTVSGTYIFVVSVTDGTLVGSKQFNAVITDGPSRLYVRQAATGNNNGSNWVNAFTDLQTALTQSKAGDEIWVAKGTYYTGSLASSYFTLKEGVKMYGGFAGTEELLTTRNIDNIRTSNETILDGSQGTVSHHVVYNTAALTAATVLDGFSIQGGKAAINSSGVSYYGGGIYNSGGAAVFRNLWIKNNSAAYGGGLYHSGDAEYTDIIFSNNQSRGTNARGAAVYNVSGFKLTKGVFQNNQLVDGGTTYGAAIFNSGPLTLNEVKFENNLLSSGYGGAIYSNSSAIININKAEFTGNRATTGGAVYQANGTGTFTDVQFKDNTATASAGALYAAGVLNINRVSFINNSSGQHGGALWSASTLKIDNTIFSRNSITSTSGYYGGAVFLSSGNALINNTSFSNNSIGYKAASTLSYGGALYRSGGTTTINNSIFWGNKRGNDIPDQVNAGIIIATSIVQNDYVGGTDIKIGDPMFENAAGDNLHLKGGSLAIDAGENNWQIFDKDLAGNPRIVNGTIDLGAYEQDGNGRLMISPAVINSIPRGTALNLQLVATGTTLPVSWSLQTGKLPTGVTFSADGKFKGVPTVVGTYTFVIGATDGQILGSKQYSITVQNGISRLFVSSAAKGDNNGSNWANAFTDVQAALELAGAGDEIWVAKGTYYSGPLATSTFKLKEGVKLYGGFAGTEAALADRNMADLRSLNETILDGSQGVASYHVITNTLALTSATILDGFSIQGGNATLVSGINYQGGGIYNNLGAVQFSNLWIKNNNGTYGGGIYNNGDAVYTNILFSNNQAKGTSARGAAVYNAKGFKLSKGIFENNKILESSSYPGYGAGIFTTGVLDLSEVEFKNNSILNGQGGAIYSNSSAVVKINKGTFTGNKATTGGALFIASGTQVLEEVTFTDNTASSSGGAIYASGVLVLNRASFIHNSAVQHGGAIWSNSNLKIDNSIFSRNEVTSTAAYYGGAIYINSNDVLINNCSFSKNNIGYAKGTVTLSYGGALYRNSGTVTIHNSILWGNTRTGTIADQLNTGVIVGSTVVQGDYATGTDVKIGDPLFMDVAVDNLQLQGGSLAIDGGDNSWQAYDKDLAGKARVVNNIIDLGAYENESTERLMINPERIEAITRGTFLNLPFNYTGTSLPVTWSLQAGKLPPGVLLTTDGKLTGVPNLIGIYTFVVGATDGNLSGNRQYKLTVQNGTGRLYVRQAATGANNGSDWTNALNDLQPALELAMAGDEIWVAKGTYYSGPLAASTFKLKEGVKMYGGFAGTETTIEARDTLKIRTDNETILDGSQGVASYHVVYNAIALTNATVLDGFSIQGGGSAVNTSNNSINFYGGGIYNSLGTVVFRNLWIKNNLGVYGAGLYHSGDATYTDVIFSNNRSTGYYARGSAVYNVRGFKLNKGVFENNRIIEGSSYPGYGAAMFSTGQADLNNIRFENNTLTNGQGGAIYVNSGAVTNLSNASFSGSRATTGGAIYFANGTANLKNIIFKDNVATAAGGVIYASGVLNIDRASFQNNTSGQHGGAIWSNATLNISNTTFSHNKISNTSAYLGGAVYIYTGTATLTNTTFSKNSIGYYKTGTVNYGGALYRNSGTVTLNNSILWGNTRGEGMPDQLNLNIKVNNVLISGGYATGLNIIDANPAFVNADGDDLALTGCSPAINTGDNNLAPAGTVDRLGNPRTKGEVIDLGAIEYQSDVITLNPATMPQIPRGAVFNLQLQGVGGTGSYTYKLVSGKLPDGLSMDASGLITGNPIVIGKYTFVINVTDGTLCGNRVYNMDVVAGTGVVRILVNQEATAGQNNGSTWENAYLDLQNALKVSLPGDQIWVAKGTYSSGTLVTSYFTLKEGVKIYGGFAATESTLAERDSLKIRTDNETILTGNNISRHVVYNYAALTAATVLDGFSISGGRSVPTGTSTGEAYIGAGIYNRVGAAIFNHLWIKNNYSNTYGGGMYNGGIGVLSNIIFENNGTVNTSGSYRYGGGLYNVGAATIRQLKFINNTAAYGGGMYQASATVTINDLLFKDNKATQGGGFYSYSGKVTLNDATFIGNTATQHGGGLYQWSSTLTVNNATFSRNKVIGTAAYFGGAFYQYTGTSTLVNVTMSNNSIAFVTSAVTKYGGAIYRNAGTLNLYNSIVWGNQRGNGVVDELNLNVKPVNALIRGGYAAGKVIVDKDPLFNLSNEDDLSLSACSPAINMGDNSLSAGILKDLAGQPRIKTEIVDLGAFESQQDRINVGPAVLPEGLRGVIYEHQMVSSGGSGSYTYAVSYGALPDGLLLSPSGRLTGRPINAGLYTFNITASDGNLCGNRLYTFEVKMGTGKVRIYVNQAATSGMNNSASWEHAFLDLQKGLSSAMAGDTIFVAKGTYVPGLKVNDYFTLKEGVKIYGGFAATEKGLADRDSTAIMTTNETILDGANRSYHVVFNRAALTDATVLDGFTISGGKTANATSTADVYNGGGIYNGLGKVIFKNLWVKNNYAYYSGGGIFNSGAATFSNITLENNTVVQLGGGLYNNAAATFKDIKFINNKGSQGGGMYHISAVVEMKDVVFKNNTATATGGAFYNATNGKPNVTSGLFVGNTAAQHGGAIYNYSGTFNLINGAFSRNRTTVNGYYGGAYYHYTGTTNIINSTFSNNTSAYINASTTTKYGGALYRNTGTVNVANSIFWGNTRANAIPDQMNTGIIVSTSTVQNGYVTGTTISTKDPQLANAAADDLSLAPCSPAINMGDNIKIAGTNKDLAGEDRIKHTVVDLGAYEFQGVYLENAEQELPAADQWTTYTHQLQLAESGSYTYFVSQGLLPDGLSLSSSGLISGEPAVAGNYEFTLAVQGSDVCGSLKVKLKVNPRAAYIIEVLKPYPVPVKKDTGTPFEQLNLVTQVEVVMSDNSHATFPVTWQPGNYDGNLEGIYELTGTLTIPNPDVNRNNLTATAKVAVITPIYSYIIAVAPLPPVKVLSGTPYSNVLPLLPKQAQVTYDDGVTKEMLNLTWKQGNYNSKVGVYRLYATLGIKEEHANPADFEANVDVYVQHNIIEVEDLADITVDLNTPAASLPLPGTVRVTYHDQTTGLLNVIWDRTPYVANKGAEYDLKGTIQLNDLVTNTGLLFANNTVIIRKNIVSIEGQYTASTPYDTPFDEVKLPETVKVNFDDGTRDTVGVEWTPGTYNQLQSGDYTLTGTLLHNESIDNKSNIKAQMILTVLPKPKNIVSIAVLDTVKVSYGTLLKAIPELTAAVKVTYDDGSSGTLNMTWDTEGYDPLVPEVYSFIGDPVLIPGVVNKDVKTAELNIQVGNKKVIAVQNPVAIIVKYGTPVEDIPFPETVNVTYNDQSVGTEGVIWSSETYNELLPGVYVFKGTLVTGDDIDNPDNLMATVSVTVGPKPLEVVSVAASTVLVPFGTSFANAQPLFPAQVKVTYDNGSTGMLNVVWEEGDYIADMPDVYELKGTLQLPEDILNPNDVEAMLTVTVGKHLIDTYTRPDSITVVFGTAPEALTLPGQLNAQFVDGGNDDLSVDWDFAPYNGNLAGSYVLNGSFTMTDEVENPKQVNPQIVVTVLPREKEIVALKADTINVAFGTPLESLKFPLISKATLDDGTVIDVAVQDTSFKSQLYNGDATGEYLFEGAIVVPQGILNTNNLMPKVVVIVDRKQIDSIETLGGISVDYDTEFDALTLPEAIKVTYNDASEELLSVSWAKGTYDGKTAGVYTLHGTMVIPDDADNPKGLQPVITVTVAERIKKLLSITRDSVEVSYGTLHTDISFPTMVKSLFDDGSTMSLTVIKWENTDYDATSPDSYEFVADVIMPPLIENPDSIKAVITVNVAPRYIISVTDPVALTVPYGTAFGTLMLPETVTVTYNNNEQDDLSVNWDSSTYNGMVAGDYILPGTIILDSPEENKDNKTTTIKITVLPKLLALDSVLVNTPLHLPFGTTQEQVLAKLGTQLDAIFTDGTTGKVAVRWESSLFNGNDPGSYSFTGLLDMEGKAENPKDITPKVEVIIDNKNVIAVETLADLIDVYGKPFSALDLPATVMVTYDDQTTANLPVLWNESEYNPELLTPQTIHGEIELTDDVSNHTNLQPQIKVTLWKDVFSVAKLAPITVKYGTPFANLGLPSSIEVTYNDGSKALLSITWDQAAYAAATIGELNLTGGLTLSSNTFNTTDQVASVKIIIEKATQTITFAPVGNKNYGDAPFKLIATASSGLPVTFELLDGKLDLNGGMATIEGAGDVVLKVLQAGDAFFAPAEAQQSFKINKAMLTVSGDTLTRYFGKENPPFTYHMKGFKYEETDTLVRADATLEGEPAFSTAATLSSPAGDYPVMLSLGTLQADNYEFTFEPGLLTVKNLYHTITFETRGGTTIDPIKIADEAKLPIVTTTKAGMIFYTWFCDEHMETVFNFDGAITESMTLYADWTITSLPDSGALSMRTVADYMLGLNELTTVERTAPFSLSLLNGKSHLQGKTAPFKLSDWYGYGPLKKALLNTGMVTAKDETAVNIAIALLNNGGTALTGSGICWSTVEHPTIADTRVNATNIDDSQVLVDGLMVGVDYYVKAFAINQAGVSYGNELVFRIKEGGLIEMIKK